jgi:hypothetical protein
MMYPIEPEDDYLCPPLDWDEFYTEETFGDRLKLFYNQFKSNTRPLLDRALFRESFGGASLDENRDGVVTGLEILCDSEIIYKRLVQKNQKIGNEIRWIWPDTVTQFKIGFYTPAWFGESFQLRDY